MKGSSSKICLILTVAVHFFVISPLLHAANFKIKPVVVSGEAAPGGEVFSAIEDFTSLNERGDLVFSAVTGNIRGGLYLLSQGSINLVARGLRAISARLPDLASLGITQIPCPFGPVCAGFEFQLLDFFRFPDGRITSCDKNVDINSGGESRINDSGQILLRGGRTSILFSGSSITMLTCPTLDFIRHTVFASNGSIQDAKVIGLTNTGTIALKLDVDKFLRGVTDDNPILLFKGGSLSILNLVGTPAPGGGTIQSVHYARINDKETLLVPFSASPSPSGPQGLFLLSGGSVVPVAFTGATAPGGKSFISFSGMQFPESVAMNNAEQVVFAAALNDGSQGIFRRDPNGTTTILVQDRTSGFAENTQVLSINERGDTIAWVRVPFVSSDIFFFSSGGGVTKVVGLNDAAPEGARFQVVERPRLNNKGEVIFFGILSNGKRGIFKASAGLETEFVDPVPDLLAGPAVKSGPPSDLAKMGRVVTGIAADGAAQVVVRVKTGQAGTVEFSLTEDGGGVVMLPANSFNGSLSQVGQSTGSSTVSVDTKNIDGVGPMAFAAYHAPNDYARNPGSSEAGEKDRKVFIRMRLRTSTGETVESTESIKIVRPPVILVHGVWGFTTSWERFEPLINNDRHFFVEQIDLAATNASQININAVQVLTRLPDLISKHNDRKQVAARRADVVTHSTGGNWVRGAPLFGVGFFRNDNFQLGDVHKLITIDAPHFGTPLATFLLRSPCVSRLFGSFGMSTDLGAVDDLVPSSRALNDLNRVTSPLQLHYIAGLASPTDQLSSETSIYYTILRLRCARDFRGFPFRGFYDAALQTPDHDMVVPFSSQLGAFRENATPFLSVIHTEVPNFLIGEEVLASDRIADAVKELLNSPLSPPDFAPFPAQR